jgi:hypothetical protein
MITLKTKVHIVTKARGRKALTVVRPPEVEQGRTPRIARLMALAIRYDRLIREGKVADISELARLCHVTQPRMTQIMNLNHLAPDIQDDLLHLPSITNGRERIHERMLRPLTVEIDWRRQRAAWSSCRRTIDRIGSGPPA